MPSSATLTRMGAISTIHSNAPEIVWWIICSTSILSAIAALIWATVMVRAWRRDLHRHRNGLCMYCGYDLRETTDRCPECGQQIIVRSFQSS